MRKVIFPILGIVVLIFAFFIFTRAPDIKTVADDQAQLILFWGNGCPHCEVVKNFIKENHADDKLKLSLKEVYYNRRNQDQLQSKVKQCQTPGLDPNNIGVPLAYIPESNQCLSGDTPIIDWIKTKI
jgi:glutaredoxin